MRGSEPWEKQDQILEALCTKRKVIVVGCNGLGKSVLAGDMAIPWFMTSRRDARVRTTAGTMPQVMNVHQKLRAAHELSRCKLPGDVMKTPHWDLGPLWSYDGVSPDNEITMQGLHSTGENEPGADGGLLGIIDEAGAPEADPKFRAMRGYFTRRNDYWLVMGNPNRSEGEFFDLWQASAHDPSWARFQISAFDVPEHIISPEWIDDQRRYWGEDSPQYQVRVLGQFPSIGGDYSVFTLSDFDGTKNLFPNDGSGKHMGVDISIGATDQNVIVLQDDGRVTDTDAWHEPDLMKTAERIAVFADEHGVPARNVHIDVIGLGAGVVHALRKAGYPVEGVNFGEQKLKGDWKKVVGRDVQMANRRAELYWAARCQLRAGHASVPEEFRRTIWSEACRIQYLPKAKIQIEPKEKVKKKLGGRSPDYADAWVLSFSRAGNRKAAYVG